jgi:hypothetical protein
MKTKQLKIFLAMMVGTLFATTTFANTSDASEVSGKFLADNSCSGGNSCQGTAGGDDDHGGGKR